MDKKTRQAFEDRGLMIREVKTPKDKFVYMITTQDNPDIQILNQSGRFFNKKKLKISGRSKRKVVEMILAGSARCDAQSTFSGNAKSTQRQRTSHLQNKHLNPPV